MNISLENKRAMVCGATAGIGKAVAEEFAALGASVTLVARNEEKLKDVQGLLANSHGQVHDYLIADFSQPEVLDQVLKQYDRQVNILVNNTGGPPPGPAHTADVEDYLAAFRQHLVCNQILVTYLVESMKADGYGRIINIVSTSVKEPIHNLGVSNTIRGAVASWAKTLANELGPFGITVNNVLPGATDTGRLRGLIAKQAEQAGVTETEAAEKMKKEIPLKRFASPAELAGAVAFLAGPSGAYISGINLPVDGGRLGCL